MKTIFKLISIGACLLATIAHSEQPYITLVSTTSTENSGLYDDLLPRFTLQTGIHVRVIAVGTGRALRLAQNGDADVLLVHHRASEEEFVRNGYGVARFDVMYNDFVFIGPSTDPAQISTAENSIEVLTLLFAKQLPFISRGDDSGTHKKEMELWALAHLDPVPFSGQWYLEVGRGMGATLNTAVAQNAYTLSDRGTWLSFKNRQNLTILFEQDPPLHNQYGVILVNPKRHPHSKAEMGQQFIDWLLSPTGQQAINAFRVDGEPLFFANAKPHNQSD